MKKHTEKPNKTIDDFIKDLTERIRAAAYHTINNGGRVTFNSINSEVPTYFDTIDYNFCVKIVCTGKEGVEAVEKKASEQAD